MAKLRQLQTRNNIGMVQFNMDAQSKENLKKAHELTLRLLQMKVSNGVILRRALHLYRLHVRANGYKAFEGDDKVRMLERVATFIQTERRQLMEAAEGNFYEDEKLTQ